MGGSVSSVTAGRNGVDVYLALRLYRRGVYGLLDTGCDTSVVSRRVIPDLQLKQTIQKLYAANGTEIALLGEVELTMTMSGHEVTAAVVVFEEVDDLILGIDWLGRHRCRWSFAQNPIEIDGKVVRFISRPRQNMLRRIYAVESTIIPPAKPSMCRRPWPCRRSARRQATGTWSRELLELGYWLQGL